MMRFQNRPNRIVLLVGMLGFLVLERISIVGSASTDNTACVPEFDRCTMPRDCCEGLSCVTGEWQYSTDSTCLSAKSAEIEQQHLTFDQRRALLEAFYEKVGVSKARDEVEHLLKKFRGEFPRLVMKLEGKYQTTFDISPKRGVEDEL